MFIKGQAVTGFPFSLITSSGAAVTTGTVTGYYLPDGGTQAALTNTPVHEGNGQWSVDLTATEMDYETIGLLFTHTSAIPASFTIATYTSSDVYVQDSGSFLGGQVGPTAFTSSDVLKRVRLITNRHVDTIEDELYEVLLDISERGHHLKTYSSGTNSSGVISLPGNIISLEAVVWNSNRIDPIAWDEYLNNIKNGYVRRGNLLYIRPTPTSAIGYTLYYRCYHPNDLDTIMIGMPFFMCTVYGVCQKKFENLSVTDFQKYEPFEQKYKSKYEQELSKVMQTIDNGPPAIARINNLIPIQSKDY